MFGKFLLDRFSCAIYLSVDPQLANVS